MKHGTTRLQHLSLNAQLALLWPVRRLSLIFGAHSPTPLRRRSPNSILWPLAVSRSPSSDRLFVFSVLARTDRRKLHGRPPNRGDRRILLGRISRRGHLCGPLRRVGAPERSRTMSYDGWRDDLPSYPQLLAVDRFDFEIHFEPDMCFES